MYLKQQKKKKNTQNHLWNKVWREVNKVDISMFIVFENLTLNKRFGIKHCHLWEQLEIMKNDFYGKAMDGFFLSFPQVLFLMLSKEGRGEVWG
jgi:hypothetical protein